MRAAATGALQCRGNSNEMCARPNEARFGLQLTQDPEQSLSGKVVIEPGIEILIHPTRTFHRKKRLESQPCRLNLWCDFLDESTPW